MGTIPDPEEIAETRASIRDRIHELYAEKMPNTLGMQGEAYVLALSICNFYDVFFQHDISHIRHISQKQHRTFYYLTKKYIVPKIQQMIDSLLISDMNDEAIAREVKSLIDFLDDRGWYKIFEVARCEIGYIAYWEEQTYMLEK